MKTERALVIELLEQARTLIATPAQWSRGGEARDAEGRIVRPWEPSAVAFCGMTAVWVAVDASADPRRDLRMAAIDALDDAAGCALEKYQDAHTHAEVLAVFDRAIAALKGADHD